MAKNKKKRARYLPKRIGGVKVPKAVRRGHFGAFLASPLGIALVAEAITELGEAAVLNKTHTGRRARKFLKHPITSARRKGRDLAHGALAFAMTEAMRTFSETLRNYRLERDEERREQEELADDGLTTVDADETFPARRIHRPEERPH